MNILVLSNYSRKALSEITRGKEELVTEASVDEILKYAIKMHIGDIQNNASISVGNANIYHERDKKIAISVGKIAKWFVKSLRFAIFIATVILCIIQLLKESKNFVLLAIYFLSASYIIFDVYKNLYINKWVNRIESNVASKMLYS